MAEPNTPNQIEPNEPVSFRPASNPFEQTEQPEMPPAPVVSDSMSATSAEPVIQPAVRPDGVELVGRRAEEKAAPPQPQKRNVLQRYLGVGGKKKQDKSAVVEKPDVPEQFLMRWSAPEFVQTHKPAGWYVGFILFFLVLIGIAIFTRQYVTVGLFAVMGVALLLYANRPPRVLQYQISNYGVYVGEKKYVFDNFDSYYETSDYGQTVLELVPNQRFGVLVSVPPPEHQLEALEDTLGQMLPKVGNRETFVDQLFRKLRF